MRMTRTASFAAALALSASALTTLTPASANTGTPPAFLRTVGGPSHAEMYPSGLEVGPDGNIVIADTGNNQVAKYTPGGTQLWRVGSYGSGTNQFWNPRDIGIDSAGTVYVVDTRNNRVVKLNGSTGAWITTFSGPTGNKISFPLGVTVTDDTVYVADSGKNRVRVFDTQGTQVREFLAGSGTCQLQDPRDADADASGNVYVANYKKHNLVKLSPTGACIAAFPTGTLATNTPYGVRIAHDPVLDADLIYTALGNENTIEVYRLNGTFVARMGAKGDASQPGTFAELRRVAVAADGDVWGADLWGWRIERFNRGASAWNYAQTIGPPLPAPTNASALHEPHQIAFQADGTAVVVDTVHHRLVKYSATGQLLSTCGGRGAAIGKFNWPRGVAIDPQTGYYWVANTKQYNVHVLRTDCTAAPVSGAKFGGFGSGLGQFNWPYQIVFRQSDRLAIVADTYNHRILTYNANTRAPIAAYGALGSGNGQFNWTSAVAVSPVNGNVFVADQKNNRIVELQVGTGGTSFSWVRTITGGLSGPQGVAVDHNGLIYVADSGNNRLVVFSANGTVFATVDTPAMWSPESVSLDAQENIWVTDTYNDRIRVYAAYDSPPPVPDTQAPTVTVTVPAQDQVFPQGPITFSGTATDNVGVQTVQVAIKNRTTNLWWRANGTWGAYQLQTVTLTAPGSSSTGWSYVWTPPSGAGLYSVLATVTDTSGNPSATKPTKRFSVNA